MKKLFFLSSVLLLLIILSGCKNNVTPEDEETISISFIPVSEVQSMEYKSSVLGDMTVVANQNNTCKITVGEKELYVDYNPQTSQYYAVYEYDGKYYGFENNDVGIKCWDFSNYSSIYKSGLNHHKFTYDSDLEKYVYEDDDGKTYVTINEQNQVTTLVVHSKRFVYEMEISGLYNETVDIPEYTVHEPLDFILNVYDTLSFSIDNNLITVTNGDWVMTYDSLSLEMELTNTVTSTSYVHNVSAKRYKVTGSDILRTIESLYETDSTIDKDFFTKCSELHQGLIDYTSIFDIPEVNNIFVNP